MKKIMLIIVTITALIAASVCVATDNTLYQADVPVPSQADDARVKAEQSGLTEVLIKLSGNPDVDHVAAIKNGILHAHEFVQEFSYEPVADAATPAYVMHIQFEPEDVKQLLKSADIPYWSKNQPSILVWMGLANAEHPSEIIGVEAYAAQVNEFKQLGKKYGLPLIFPVMDVADISQVATSDVTSMAMPALKEAGKRYAADVLLIGNVQPGANGYQSQWKLVSGESEWSWNIDDATLNGVITQMLNQASQALVKHYTVKTVNSKLLQLKLNITNIAHRSDLSQLQQYLKQLQPVQKVQLSQVSADNVELAVQVIGSQDTFKQVAAIGPHLVFKSEDKASHTLTFEWMN